MPFAGFDDFDSCVRTMTEEEGHDEEAAESICGALQAEAKSEHGNVEELREALAAGRGLIADVGVDLVSGVDVPAVNSKWVMLKSDDDDHDYRVNTPILLAKDDADSEKRISYAAAMIPREPDKERDVVSTPTVEKAAHDFLQQHGGVDTDHSLIDGDGEVVESWVLKETREFDLPDGGSESYTEGTWMVGIKWEADPWQRIKDGELTGLSIYGMAEHVALGKSVSDCPECGESLSVAKSEEGYAFTTEGDAYRDMGEETPVDTEALAASLGDSLREPLTEAVKDGVEDAKTGDLQSLIDQFVEQATDLDGVDKDSSELRDAIKAALDGQAEKSAEDLFAESVDVGDHDAVLGFKDARPDHLEGVDLSAAVADVLKEDDDEDEEEDEDDEEEKAEGETDAEAEETGKSVDDANLGKGGDARSTAAKGIRDDAGGSAPSYAALADEAAADNGGD